jgi:hypothetical protein
VTDSSSNEKENKTDEGRDSVSVIYHHKSESPKYFEIKKSKIFLLLIGLPTITLISLVIGAIGLVHTSPFHLVKNVRESRAAQIAVDKQNALIEENEDLKQEVENLKANATEVVEQTPAAESESPKTETTKAADGKCPAPVACPATTASPAAQAIGLSTLSFFKPIQGQKDRTRPAQINLSGFKTVTGRDTVSLQFNIIPASGNDQKISGHIIVLMKNEQGISVYPAAALTGSDSQISYSSGEPFATQRFRPVDASFLKPRKAGNYIFSIFIFSRSGDLIHYQNAPMVIKL